MFRSRPKPSAPLLQPLGEERTLLSEGQAVLSYTLTLPHLVGEGRGVASVERYYRRLAQAWLARWKGPLFHRAKAAGEAALSRSRPFSPWHASLTCAVTLQSAEVLSLWWEVREELGAPARTLRQGETWSLRDGAPLPLKACLPPNLGRRRKLLTALKGQVEGRAGGLGAYPDWPARLRRSFRPERFWLTPEGPVVFFPPGSLCPPERGWTVLPLPLPRDAEGRGAESSPA